MSHPRHPEGGLRGCQDHPPYQQQPPLLPLPPLWPHHHQQLLPLPPSRPDDRGAVGEEDIQARRPLPQVRRLGV